MRIVICLLSLLSSILVQHVAGAQITITPSAALHSSSTDNNTDTTPRIAVNTDGLFMATWYSFFNYLSSGSDSDILAVSFSGNTGSNYTPALVNSTATADPGTSDDRPRIGADGLGNFVIAWKSFYNLASGGTEGDVVFSRSADDGASWSAIAHLNTEFAGDTAVDDYVSLAGDDEGHWVAIWQSTNTLGGTIGTDADLLYVRSEDGGATWSTTKAFNSTAAADNASDMTVTLANDGGDHWVAVWVSNYNLGGTIGTDTDIFVQHSDDDGVTWSAAAALNSDAATPSAGKLEPVVATDKQGNWICIWRSQNPVDGNADYDIFYAKSTNNGATWSDAALLQSNAATDGTAIDQELALAANSSGEFVAVWRGAADISGNGTDADIFYSVSVNGGTVWTDVAVFNDFANGDTTEPDLQPTVASDDAGNWVVVWNSKYDLGGLNTDEDILFSRMTINIDPPAVTAITPALAGPTNADTIDFEVVFSQDVINFDDATDLLITHNGTAHSGVLITGGPATYTATLQGVTGDGTFDIAINTGSDVQNVYGLALSSGGPSASMAVDNSAPAVTLESTAPDPTNSWAGITVTLSESVTSFDINDLATVNSTVADFEGSGGTYSFRLVPQADGPFEVRVDTAVFTDAVGNPSTASNTITRVYDGTAPTFSNIVADPAEARDGDAVSITFDSEEASLVSLEVYVNGNPATQSAKAAYTFDYTIAASDPAGPAMIEIFAADPAGNPGSATNDTALYILATVPVQAWPLLLLVGVLGTRALRTRRRA
jgi:hypothetical protein